MDMSEGFLVAAKRNLQIVIWQNMLSFFEPIERDIYSFIANKKQQTNQNGNTKHLCLVINRSSRESLALSLKTYGRN